MGVIHKLRDDVIDFIVAQKKADPEISCRRLSDIVSKKFSTVVSKSSVSTVLKNANLNSPVGRHGFSEHEPAPKAPPKFKIPFSLSPSPAAKEVKEKKIQAPKQDVKPAPRPVIKEKVLISEMSNLKVQPKPAPESGIKSIENAGSIFLKAAEWDLAGGSILGRIIQDELSGRFDVDYEALSDLLLFPELNFINLDDKRAVLDPQIYPALSAAVNDISDSAVKIAIELELLSRSVASVKMTDRDGGEAFLNLRQRVIDFSNVQSDGGVSVSEAVRIIGSGAFNVQSVVFHYISNVNNIPNLLKFLSTITTKGGLKEISLRDENGIELTKDRHFSRESSMFVLAVWTWQKHMPGAEALFKSKTDFMAVPFLNKTFYMAQIALPGLPSPVKAVALSMSPFPTGEAFVVLLTNSTDHKKALLEFLHAWPGLGGGVACAEGLGSRNPPVLEAPRAGTFVQNIGAVKNLLNRWVCERFLGLPEASFDEKTMKESFYQLPGTLREDDSQMVLIALNAPPGHPYSDLLKKAVRYFNSRLFCDSRGRRIFLQLPL